MRDFLTMCTNHTAPVERRNLDEGARLSVENLSWSEPRSQRKIIQPIRLELAPGRVLGIVGPNGAGKSTLLRLLYRYHVPTTGSVKVDNVDIWSVPARVAAQTVAAVLQEQITDFALTVREIVTLGVCLIGKVLAAALVHRTKLLCRVHWIDWTCPIFQAAS